VSGTKWSDLKEKRSGSTGARVGYMRARTAYRLAERVRLLREARGITQGEMAARMHTTQSAIARLESGGTHPTLSTLERVSEALGAELVVEFKDAVRPRQVRSLASVATRVLRVTARRRSVTRRAKTVVKRRR